MYKKLGGVQVKTGGIRMVAGIAFGMVAVANAQLTWDVVPGVAGAGDGAITHSNGVWSTAVANWTADNGANNQAWVNGSDVLFSANAEKSAIQVDLGTGVTVGDITIEPVSSGGAIDIIPVVDGETLAVAAGGATWDLGGRTMRLGSNKANDLNVSIASGDTLSVVSTGGGGILNTGANPDTGNWAVSGATLDFQANKLLGDVRTVGEFSIVKMAAGTTYSHERNSGSTYANDWELGAGQIAFENRYSRNITLNGVVSGAGTLVAKDLGGNRVELLGANTFSGGVVVQADVAGDTELRIFEDAQLGAVPAMEDPDHITLINDGILGLDGVVLNANRGITLDGGGRVRLKSVGSTYGGVITGTGDFKVDGSSEDGVMFVLSGTGSDYDGITRIDRGTLGLGVDNALPSGTELVIGSYNSGVSAFEMNGFDQTVLALRSRGSNTQIITNAGATVATLTINDGATFEGDVGGVSKIHLVKNGPSTQRFSKNGLSNPFEGATVNEGRLRFDYPGEIDYANITVNSGGEFVVDTTDGLGDGRWGVADIDALLASATFEAGSYLVLNGVAGNFVYPSVISGAVGVGHNNTNDLTLIAVNTYTGGTYVENDCSITLASSGSIADSAYIELRGSAAVFDVSAKAGFALSAGQDLTGIGAVNGSLAVSASSVISPDSLNADAEDVLGVLTFANDIDLSAIGAGNLAFDLGTNGYDRIVVNGTLSISSLGMSAFSFTDLDALENGVYTLFDAAALSGSLDGLDLTGPVGSNGAQGTLSISGSDVVLTVTGGADHSAYGQWAAGYDLSGDDAAEDADPDTDGYNNLEEFAYGGNPTNSAAAGNVPVLGEAAQDGTNYFTYVYTYNTNASYGVTYTFGTRPDLVFGEWTNIHHVVLGAVEQVDGFKTVTNGVDKDAFSEHFFRLLLEKQP